MTQVAIRSASPINIAALYRYGFHPILARLYAARGIRSPNDVETTLTRLIPPNRLKGCIEAAALLADMISENRKLVVVADYDCDGATACAVAIRGLRMFGARVEYLVPNRFEYGYGLTPEIVELAAMRNPDLLITVDNGISSITGVEAANSHGINVLVTDHHLPGNVLPEAHVIVNPNQQDCSFPSKNIAGVGVIFYVLLALRAELRRRGIFSNRNVEPRLDGLLDLVAIGTVADAVQLDYNNRVLVAQGLKRIRDGRMQPGIAALFHIARCDTRSASWIDLGFSIGPRINAAGRLADMSIGIKCLITNNNANALEFAKQLDAINKKRREIVSLMQKQVINDLAQIKQIRAHSITLFNSKWHHGVIGIVAGWLKDRFYLPSFTFAPANKHGDIVKGSGRSVQGFHLFNALNLLSKREPDLLITFGGHSMAAGVTINISNVERFASSFDIIAHELLSRDGLERIIEIDGELEEVYFTPQIADLINSVVWGQGFPEPMFFGEFDIISYILIKGKHLKIHLATKNQNHFKAIWFNHIEPLHGRVRIVYRLINNKWNNINRVQLVIEYVVPPESVIISSSLQSKLYIE
ncbi:MAG: single-stranded-DNA-specific exonuclease RecJ [Burkholderia sp.]|nr:single-stranded-DNA-specific exonuclease RecJ [Burkholderia sp.]